MEKTPEVIVTYREVAIALVEASNKWKYTVNSRERTAENLTNAKANIDKVLDGLTKTTKWKPVKALLTDGICYGREFSSVTITSLAEPNRYGGGPEAWIKRSDGSRTKVQVKELYADTEANRAVIAKIDQFNKAIKKVEAAMRALRSKLASAELPTQEE